MLFSYLLCNHLLLVSHLNILGLIALIKCGVLPYKPICGIYLVQLALCVASLNWLLYGLQLIVGHKKLQHLMLLHLLLTLTTPSPLTLTFEPAQRVSNQPTHPSDDRYQSLISDLPSLTLHIHK